MRNLTAEIQERSEGVLFLLEKLRISNPELAEKLDIRNHSSRGDSSGCDNTTFTSTWDSWSDQWTNNRWFVVTAVLAGAASHKRGRLDNGLIAVNRQCVLLPNLSIQDIRRALTKAICPDPPRTSFCLDIAATMLFADASQSLPIVPVFRVSPVAIIRNRCCRKVTPAGPHFSSGYCWFVPRPRNACALAESPDIS